MYHTIILTGNLGGEPELKVIEFKDNSGNPAPRYVVNFNVASTEGPRDNQRTIWFHVTAWGKIAEIFADLANKGDRVLVEGKLAADQNGNPKIFTRGDGTPAASFEITASTLRVLSFKNPKPQEDMPF